MVLINLNGSTLDMGFKLTGEGFVLISQVSYAVSTLLINCYSKKMSPVLLSGSQFFAGGILLFIIGKFMGGHLDKLTAAGLC